MANKAQTDGKNFFSADHKNLFSSADAVLDFDGLTLAEVMFSQQVREGNRPLGIPAKYLLVPTALKVQAEQLMHSLTLNETTTANKPSGTSNVHAGKFEVVSTPNLSSSAFTGSSSANWYLQADPNRLAALEVAFLNGTDKQRSNVPMPISIHSASNSGATSTSASKSKTGEECSNAYQIVDSGQWIVNSGEHKYFTPHFPLSTPR